MRLGSLFSNAAKHGIDARGRRDILLSVQDDGRGFEPGAAVQRSSGLGFVQGLVNRLHGSFIVEKADGARCVVRVPEKLAS